MSGGLFTDNRPHEVTIVPKGSNRADGTAAYDATEVDTLAWVHDKTGMIRKANGREVIYARVFYLDRHIIVEVGDRIRFEDRNHEVLSVTLGKDINGRTDHKKAWTGAGV